MELNNCSLFDAHPKQLTECDRCSKPDNLGIQSKQPLLIHFSLNTQASFQFSGTPCSSNHSTRSR